jgi:lactate dehydrogenase-like 2-hydroxyacid dehydrogenase
MSKPKLVVTSRFTEPVEGRINREYDVVRSADDSPLTPERLVALTVGTDAMMVTPSDRLDAEFFNRISPSVKVIATYSVGLDHIYLHAAAATGIKIAYTPGVNADATADIAMLLMLGASRRAHEGQEMLRSQTWASTHTIYLGWQMTHKILGIVGMGQVGQAVALRARAFGMEIHYTNPRKLDSGSSGDAVFHEELSD